MICGHPKQPGEHPLLKRVQLWFQTLRVSQKLMLISIFFIMPDSLMLYLFITGINGHIEFARMEKKGNDYQRPLATLLELIPQHLLLAERARQSPTPLLQEQVARKQGEIAAALKSLEEIDLEVGVDLQFTDEGLAKRKREHFRAATVRREWRALVIQLPETTAEELSARHDHLVADIRMMITHAGDLSNLILDPDLDSYYVMDATLLALPQTQDRLAKVIAHGRQVLDGGAISEAERQRMAVSATLLREADLDRIAGSLQTALNEDANFHGASPSLQRRLPPATREYRVLTEEFIRLTQSLADNRPGDLTARDYVLAGSLARESSFRLWHVATGELDRLLLIRTRHYQDRRFLSLLVAALAGLAATGFVTFITRSISGPLQAQAQALQSSNDALQDEIADRERAESGLRHSEAQLATAQEIARIGSWCWDVPAQRMSWSQEYCHIHGWEPGKVEPSREVVLQCAHPQDRALFDASFEAAVKHGRPFSFEQRIIAADGAERILQQRGAVRRDASGAIAEVFGTAQDITERKVAERELEAVHRQLLDVSRQAGMAEVATGVLHNVGNVLNSVNVSAMLLTERLAKSRVAHLTNVCTLLRENSADLGTFITTDSRGRKVPAFLSSLAERLGAEQVELQREVEGLSKNILHIKEVVAMQQTYAKVSGVLELLSADELVEDALGINGAAFDRHAVQVVRAFSAVPRVQVDKHKVLQILINVIRNAKYAVSESPRLDKQIIVRLIRGAPGRVLIVVEDNGIGIAEENLSRIFAHGFTTKKEGHGFGLHSSALAAAELHGSLSVLSAGPGHGATFTLDLPAGEDDAADINTQPAECLLLLA